MPSSTRQIRPRFRHLLRPLLGLASLALAVLAAPGSASAYPQWQFSSGSDRCNQCHFGPAGGGLVTGYGRDKSGEELSTWEGNGAFLHGSVDLPSWLSLGADLRGAAVQNDPGDPGGAELHVFPMQADAYVRVAASDTISVAVTAGYRGQARKSPGPVGGDNYEPAPTSRFVSREHYLMWRPAALGPYARAGRFYAPYGLRMAEHTTYVRRDMGFNMLEETYGASGGVVRKDWEAHVTAFVPDVIQNTGSNRESGLAAMLEYRAADGLALGIQTRAGLASGAGRYAGGTFAKGWLESLNTLLMTELNLVHRAIGDTTPSQQFIGLVGATYFPYRGIWLSGYLERSQTSIAARDSALDAINGQINWFPYPHFELVILGRIQRPSAEEPARAAMLQLHYYL